MLVKTLCSIVFILAFVSLASSDAQAQTIYPRDGKIEYIKFVPDGLEIKLTSSGIEYGSAFMNARKLAERVKSHTEKTYKVCSAISINKLAWKIQYHCVAYSLRIKRNHANPVNVTWREIM